MDRDTVVKLASDSGFGGNQRNTLFVKLTRFATLVRNAALEEAAKAADVVGAEMEDSQPNKNYDMACGYCADAIRALKE